jgi:peptidoglycan/LPS O-acetylase OafA/YrhL
LEQSGRIRVPPILLLLGGASYAIYLVHFSAITLLAVVLIQTHFVPMDHAVFLVAAVFGVAAGVVFDRLVDQPIQRLLRRRLKPALLGVERHARALSPKVADANVRPGVGVGSAELPSRGHTGWSDEQS